MGSSYGPSRTNNYAGYGRGITATPLSMNYGPTRAPGLGQAWYPYGSSGRATGPSAGPARIASADSASQIQQGGTSAVPSTPSSPQMVNVGGQQIPLNTTTSFMQPLSNAPPNRGPTSLPQLQPLSGQPTADQSVNAFMSLPERARAELIKHLPQGDMSQYGMGMQGSGIADSIAGRLFGANFKAITGQDFQGNAPYNATPGYSDKYAPWVNSQEYSQNSSAAYEPLTGLLSTSAGQMYFDPRMLGYTPQYLQALGRGYGNPQAYIENARRTSGISGLGGWMGG